MKNFTEELQTQLKKSSHPFFRFEMRNEGTHHVFEIFRKDDDSNEPGDQVALPTDFIGTTTDVTLSVNNIVRILVKRYSEQLLTIDGEPKPARKVIKR